MKEVFEGLQPFLAQVNELIAKSKAEGVELTPELARNNLAGLARFISDVPAISYAEEREIRSMDRSIPVRVYSPSPQESLPVFLYFHGGGHMSGSPALYDPMCRKIAIAAHCIVISVDYRLAPEHPYPAGIDDCYQTLMQYQEVLNDLEYSTPLILGGDSAGGAITSTLTAWSATDPAIRFDKQVLIYPGLDYTMSHSANAESRSGYLLESARISWYFQHYFQNGEDLHSVSPLFAPLPENPPETLLITAGFDPLLGESLAYFERLQQAGARVEHLHFEDMIHAFMNLEDMAREQCQRLYQEIGRFINQRA